MAFDIVTAKKGYNHVTADQASDMQAGIFGKGRYALDTGNGLACSMTDSNTLTVDTGSLIADGRHIVNDRAATFAIANGTQSAYRHDLAVLNVSIDSSTGVTTIEQDVLQGTPASTESAAEDPEYTAGNLLDGDLEATIPVARVSLAGLTPTCEPMLSSVSNLAALGDSVSRKALSVVSVKSGFTVNAWKTALGVQLHVVGTSSSGLITSGEKWGYEIAKIPEITGTEVCGLTGFVWSVGANYNDSAWFHIDEENGSLRIDFKTTTQDWPYTIHCEGIMAYA